MPRIHFLRLACHDTINVVGLFLVGGSNTKFTRRSSAMSHHGDWFDKRTGTIMASWLRANQKHPGTAEGPRDLDLDG